MRAEGDIAISKPMKNLFKGGLKQVLPNHHPFGGKNVMRSSMEPRTNQWEIKIDAQYIP